MHPVRNFIRYTKIGTDGSQFIRSGLGFRGVAEKSAFSVVIPQILPGIISGFLLAVTLSLDDFVIADYTKPDTFQTISTHIYYLRANTIGTKTKASYWAFTAIIFLIIVIVLVTTNIISYKKSRSKKQ